METAIGCARQHAATGGVLLGFDAPFGIPTSFWDTAVAHMDPRPRHFAEWLPRLEPSFFEAVTRPEQWSVRQPFFAVPPRAEGLKDFIRAAARQHADLFRGVDRRVGGKSPFVVAGIPGSVGSAARDLWRHLPAHRKRDVGIWPFDGSIDDVLATKTIVVAEIYPTLAYAAALAPRVARPGKAADTWRRIVSLLEASDWFGRFHVELSSAPDACSSRDALDACVSAAAILRCVLEESPLCASDPDPIAEGGILCESLTS